MQSHGWVSLPIILMMPMNMTFYHSFHLQALQEKLALAVSWSAQHDLVAQLHVDVTLQGGPLCLAGEFAVACKFVSFCTALSIHVISP